MSIEVSVFYVGRGASILVDLGDGRFGVVDCYSGRDGRGPLVKALNQKTVESIEFIVLTHPHEDHVMGIGSLLKRYGGKVKRLFDCGLDPRHVAASAYPSTAREDVAVVRELARLEKFVRSKAMSGRSYGLSCPGTLIYEDIERGVRFWSVAPIGDVARRAGRSLERYFARFVASLEGESAPPLVSGVMDLNLLSSAVLMEVGGAPKVLFGGDVLVRCWNQIIGKGRSLRADVVVLSHHGSHTGFPRARWGDGFGLNRGNAVVSGEGRHQPSPSVVEHLERSGATLFSTVKGAASEGRAPIRRYVSRFHHGERRTVPGRRLDLRLVVDKGRVAVDELSL